VIFPVSSLSLSPSGISEPGGLPYEPEHAVLWLDALGVHRNTYLLLPFTISVLSGVQFLETADKKRSSAAFMKI
jgi:hypothetical protein